MPRTRAVRSGTFGMRTTTTRTHQRTHRSRILLVALASAAALVLAAGATTAAAAPATSFTPTNKCWLDVINDWLAHQPNVQNLYPIPCYTQAIQHLTLYQDVQQYSSATDDIHRALLAALLEERGNGPGSGSSSGGGSTPPSSSSGTGTPPTSSSSSSSASEGPITKLFDSVRPGNATSVPLPLLVLGALAGLLLLAAAGTWGARRIQARKMTPAPQPATSPPSGPSRKPR